MNIRERNYKNFGNCLELSNGEVDLLVTLEEGPRIIRYGFVDGVNALCDEAPMSLDTENGRWELMGGHRLWHSPEAFPRTYMPDNDPVEWCEIPGGIRIAAPVQPWVQMGKEMDISMNDGGADVRIVHRIINKNAWPVECAVWALTVLAPGGVHYIPIPREEIHYSEGAKGLRVLSFWSYADLNDPRLEFGKKLIRLRQESGIENNFKMGILNKDGWACYLNRGNMFIKKFPYIDEAKYPDGGVCYEAFTCSFMMEMESLSPLRLLKPGEAAEHIEEWTLIPENGIGEHPGEDEIKELVSGYM